MFKYLNSKYNRITSILTTTLTLLALTASYYIWNKGTPYGERIYDQSGKFHIQRYSTRGPSLIKIAMPGNGSDNIDGFIRLYDSNDKLLDEYFTTYLIGVTPTWFENSVWLMGTSNEITWKLP